MSVTLRDTCPEDQAFLLAVFATTRAQEMALVPWTEEQREAFIKMQFDAQDSFYHEQYPAASYQLIVDNGERVGRLYVHRTEEEIDILDITVLPPNRNAGLGTSLIRELLVEGAQTGKSVRIWVEHFNPSLSLFERLGFSRIQEDGFNYLLEYKSASATSE